MIFTNTLDWTFNSFSYDMLTWNINLLDDIVVVVDFVFNCSFNNFLSVVWSFDNSFIINWLFNDIFNLNNSVIPDFFFNFIWYLNMFLNNVLNLPLNDMLTNSFNWDFSSDNIVNINWLFNNTFNFNMSFIWYINMFFNNINSVLPDYLFNMVWSIYMTLIANFLFNDIF